MSDEEMLEQFNRDLDQILAESEEPLMSVDEWLEGQRKALLKRKLFVGVCVIGILTFLFLR